MRKCLLVILISLMVLMVFSSAVASGEKYSDLEKMLNLIWDDPLNDKLSQVRYDEDSKDVIVVLTLKNLASVNWNSANGKKFGQQVCNFFTMLLKSVMPGDELSIVLTETMNDEGIGYGLVVTEGPGIIAIVNLMTMDVLYTQLQ